MKPITPAEALVYKQNKIPDFVYEVFNELISETFNGTYSFFTQNEVLNKLALVTTEARSTIFKNHWLDIEFKYREAGWTVRYESDGCDGAYYNFSK